MILTPARWFNPSLGRFLSPDTIVPTSTQGTQAWDRYAFVNNNPVRYTDPTGHRSCEEDGYNCDEESESGEAVDSNQEDNPIESYCGDTSTLGCISMLAQDAATLLDLVGVGLIEAPLVAGGCLEGGLLGCAAGEVVAAGIWSITLNPIEMGLSFASTGLTIFDDLINNGGIGENTITSVATSLAGAMAPTPSSDLLIDGYASGFNHGLFNGLITIGNGGSLFNW